MNVVDLRRFAGGRRFIEHRLPGITAASDADDAHHFVADGEPSGLGTALLDDPRHIPARCVRQKVFFDRWILTAANFKVDRIDAGGLDAHQHLQGIRHRDFHLLDVQHVRASEAVKACHTSFHMLCLEFRG